MIITSGEPSTPLSKSSYACAKALGVPASQLIGDEPQPNKKKTGPVSQLERRFQEVKRLPKKKQDFILQFLDNMLDKA